MSISIEAVTERDSNKAVLSKKEECIRFTLKALVQSNTQKTAHAAGKRPMQISAFSTLQTRARISGISKLYHFKVTKLKILFNPLAHKLLIVSLACCSKQGHDERLMSKRVKLFISRCYGKCWHDTASETRVHHFFFPPETRSFRPLTLPWCDLYSLSLLTDIVGAK